MILRHSFGPDDYLEADLGPQAVELPSPADPRPVSKLPAILFRSFEQVEQKYALNSCSSAEFACHLRKSFCSRFKHLFPHGQRDIFQEIGRPVVTSYCSRSDAQLLAEYDLVVQARQRQSDRGKAYVAFRAIWAQATGLGWVG